MGRGARSRSCRYRGVFCVRLGLTGVVRDLYQPERGEASQARLRAADHSAGSLRARMRPPAIEACIENHLRFAKMGAIAQLGERLICIQEVVGSIPSGSTIVEWPQTPTFCLASGAGVGVRPLGYPRMSAGGRSALRAFGPGLTGIGLISISVAIPGWTPRRASAARPNGRRAAWRGRACRRLRFA